MHIKHTPLHPTLCRKTEVDRGKHIYFFALEHRFWYSLDQPHSGGSTVYTLFFEKKKPLFFKTKKYYFIAFKIATYCKIFYVRREVDLMKTAKVNGYIMHIF